MLLLQPLGHRSVRVDLPRPAFATPRCGVAQVDRLIERAEREADETRRRAVYHAIQRRLLDDLPYVPLWFEDHVFVARHDIRGYTTNVDGHFDALRTIDRKPRDDASNPH